MRISYMKKLITSVFDHTTCSVQIIHRENIIIIILRALIRRARNMAQSVSFQGKVEKPLRLKNLSTAYSGKSVQKGLKCKHLQSGPSNIHRTDIQTQKLVAPSPLLVPKLRSRLVPPVYSPRVAGARSRRALAIAVPPPSARYGFLSVF